MIVPPAGMDPLVIITVRISHLANTIKIVTVHFLPVNGLKTRTAAIVVTEVHLLQGTSPTDCPLVTTKIDPILAASRTLTDHLIRDLETSNGSGGMVVITTIDPRIVSLTQAGR